MRKVTTQNMKELIGRRVRQEMKKQGLSAEELAKLTGISLNFITQLVEGQPLWLSHDREVKLAKALKLHEGKGGGPFPVQVEDLSDGELDSLFYPTPPEQLEMEFDDDGSDQ